MNIPSYIFLGVAGIFFVLWLRLILKQRGEGPSRGELSEEDGVELIKEEIKRSERIKKG